MLTRAELYPIKKVFSIDEKLQAGGLTHLPHLRRGMNALGHILRFQDGVKRAVRLGRNEAVISTGTDAIGAAHIPYASDMRPVLYRDAVLGFLNIVATRPEGPELLERVFTGIKPDRDGVTTLCMDAVLSSFRRACYPDLPAPLTRTRLKGDLHDLFFQRIIQQDIKPDVSWLTILFLLQPNFPVKSVKDLGAIESTLPTSTLSVPVDIFDKNRDRFLAINGVLTGGLTTEGKRVAFRGPISQESQAALGFPRKTTLSPAEPETLWGNFDVITGSKLVERTIELTLFPDFAVMAPVAPRIETIGLNRFSEIFMTGYRSLYESTVERTEFPVGDGN